MSIYPIFAIDPGPNRSGWVSISCRDGRVESGVDDNARVRELVYLSPASGTIAIEMIASYGMAVGADVFLTCVEIGRLVEAAHASRLRSVIRVTRLRVKLALCHSPRATDTNIRQALLDRYGGKERAVGRKAAPGPLYGVKSHAWAALAVACCVVDGLEPMREIA